MRRWRIAPSLAVTGALALLVTGLSWSRVWRDGRVTGPQRVEWRGPDDRPIETSRMERMPCRSLLRTDLVHDGRLIVSCISSRPEHEGYAWIDPGRGAAKLEWPVPSELGVERTLAYAPGADGALGIVYESRSGDRTVFVAAIAGRDGWASAPVVFDAEPPEDRHLGPDLIGVAYRDGALEVVLTRIRRDESPPAPEVVRIRGGQVQRTRLPVPAGCVCSPVFALPTPRGWKLAVRIYGREVKTAFIDEAGALVEVPDGWWSDPDAIHETDRTAIGLIEHVPRRREQILDPSGARRPLGAPPLPGYEAAVWLGRLVYESGPWGLRRKLTWMKDSLVAQVAGDRVFVGGPAPEPDDDVLRLGDHPDRTRPVLRTPDKHDFLSGQILTGPSGTAWWVSIDGEYVTLDAELRRTDPRSLVHHLRTNGSTDDWNRAQRPLLVLGWALFGLPVALALGWLLAQRRRRAPDGAPRDARAPGPLSLCLALYAATALWAFVHTLPVT